MTAEVLFLDDFRPRVTESMHCLFCRTTHVLRHIVDPKQRYFSCPGCDEVASIPERQRERQGV
jgi:hypothetical protein